MEKTASLSSSADLFPRLLARAAARTTPLRMATPPRRAKEAAEAEVTVYTVPVVAAVERTKVASATEAKAMQATM